MLKTILPNEIQLESINQIDPVIEQSVKSIIEDVRINQDEALIKYTNMFDKVTLKSFKITQQEIDQAYDSLNPILISDLNKAFENIKRYHKEQKRVGYIIKSEDGSYTGQRITAIDSVGVYVPGGTAPLPSSVLMNATPALIAGVKRIVLVTPPDKFGKIPTIILAACKIVGISEVYSIGGAQAIAALAYGTETISPVNKIVGPGNIYVTLAKKIVYGVVGIDMIAGPSEIVVFADEQAKPSFIAADLLSQAEHDTLAKSILVTTSKQLIDKVSLELEKQTPLLSRKDIIKESLQNNAVAILTRSNQEAYDVINQIAPEHLELMVENVELALKNITNAGAIFVGEFSPEPLGDYFAGPNHTLPTSGTAKFSSPLNVDDFLKKTSIIYYTKETLNQCKDSIIRIAQEEGLTAHSNAIKERFK